MGDDKGRKGRRWPFIRKQSEQGTEYIHYPAASCDFLPEDYKLYAMEVLNETEENKAKGIQKLSEFVKRENLICPDTNHLIMVLRCCKYNIKKSETKLKRFLTMRQIVISHLARMDMKIIEMMVDDNFISMLPHRDRNGRIIFVTRPQFQLDKYDIYDVGYCCIAYILFLLTFPMSQVYGMTYIPDSTCSTLSIYYPVIKMFRKFLPLMMDLPFRIARVDIANEHFLARWLYTVLRPVLPGKLTKRVTFHGTNYTKMHKYYHPDILPEDVGGTLGPVCNKHYKEDLLNFLEKLRNENGH